MGHPTKRKLLNDYVAYLAERLAEAEKELEELKGMEGDTYHEDAINEVVRMETSSYRYDYKEDDFEDLIGKPYLRLAASDFIDEDDTGHFDKEV